MSPHSCEALLDSDRTYLPPRSDQARSTSRHEDVMRTASQRRRLSVALVAALLVAPLTLTERTKPAAAGGSAAAPVDSHPLPGRPGWRLRWAPEASRDGLDGWVRWVVRNGETTVIDTTTTGVDTWLFDRVRPKWGIYRSLRDTSGSLQDAYLLITNLRAYQWSDTNVAPLTFRYEAEDATIHHGAVESGFGGFTGSGFVNYADEAGSYVEWTIHALGPGTATLNIWYANATTTNRPMDVTVNGVLVAAGLAIDRTPAWNDWETRTLVVPLHPGRNTVRATATTDAGGPNVDSLEVQQQPGLEA